MVYARQKNDHCFDDLQTPAYCLESEFFRRLQLAFQQKDLTLRNTQGHAKLLRKRSLQSGTICSSEGRGRLGGFPVIRMPIASENSRGIFSKGAIDDSLWEMVGHAPPFFKQRIREELEFGSGSTRYAPVNQVRNTCQKTERHTRSHGCGFDTHTRRSLVSDRTLKIATEN